MSDHLETLEALAGRLDDIDTVRGAAVHTPYGRGPWIELLVEASSSGRRSCERSLITTVVLAKWTAARTTW
jgi:hypothetical protein